MTTESSAERTMIGVASKIAIKLAPIFPAFDGTPESEARLLLAMKGFCSVKWMTMDEIKAKFPPRTG